MLIRCNNCTEIESYYIQNKDRYKGINDVLFNINSYVFFIFIGLCTINFQHPTFVIIILFLSLFIICSQIFYYYLYLDNSSYSVLLTLLLFNLLLVVIIIIYIYMRMRI